MDQILMHLLHQAEGFQLYPVGDEDSVKDLGHWRGSRHRGGRCLAMKGMGTDTRFSRSPRLQMVISQPTGRQQHPALKTQRQQPSGTHLFPPQPVHLTLVAFKCTAAHSHIF